MAHGAYHWIEKWGEITGLPRHDTLALVWRAWAEGAPADAVYRDGKGHWKTVGDITDLETLKALGLIPAQAGIHADS